jgi:hypothetical protein
MNEDVAEQLILRLTGKPAVSTVKLFKVADNGKLQFSESRGGDTFDSRTLYITGLPGMRLTLTYGAEMGECFSQAISGWDSSRTYVLHEVLVGDSVKCNNIAIKSLYVYIGARVALREPRIGYTRHHTHAGFYKVRVGVDGVVTRETFDAPYGPPFLNVWHFSSDTL